MIKFKEFNVGDADYEEQIEQFQAEHQNAEFLLITGGHMSYEKIWFKYEPSDSTDKLSVEKLQEIRIEELKDFNSKILQAELKNQKLQEQLNTAKNALTEITKIPESDNYFDCEECVVMMEESAKQALAAIGGDDEL